MAGGMVGGALYQPYHPDGYDTGRFPIGPTVVVAWEPAWETRLQAMDLS